MTQPSRAASALLSSVAELLACRAPSELAGCVAAIAQRLLPSEGVRVVLNTPEGEGLAELGAVPAGLAEWGLELLRGQPKPQLSERGSWLAATLGARAEGVHGVVALSGAPLGEEERRVLSALAQLAGASAAQLAESLRSGRILAEAQRSLGKGLHDLRTPLNSLRLALHLLEPALVTQDPAIVQRTHRAVDRMAALVSEMYEVLHGAQAAEPKSS